MLADSLFPMRPRYMLVSVPYFLILVSLAFERFGMFDDGPLLKRPGKTIATVYALIAATALETGLSVLTRNRRDFERAPGLGIVSPA